MARILFFGRLRDAAGTHEDSIDLEDGIASVPALIERLAAGDAALAAALSAPSVKVVADGEIIRRSDSILGAQEIAFLPPASGG
jgi:molybdopterin converting factor small subunit